MNKEIPTTTLKYSITPKIIDEHTVEFLMETQYQDAIKQLAHATLNLKDEAVKAALESLGWISPEDVLALKDLLKWQDEQALRPPTNVMKTTEGNSGHSTDQWIRCASCKYWGAEPGERGNPRLRSCGHPKHVMGYQSAVNTPDDGMIIESDEGWGMEVGPLFGCVNGVASMSNDQARTTIQ